MTPNHARRILVSALTAIALAGCANMRPEAPPTTTASGAQPSEWPTAADYTTIRIARIALDQALFHETDWRRRSFTASLAMQTLLTIRLRPGRCATYVNRLYDELWSLFDAASGENWAPLETLVQHDPTVRAACRRPTPTASRITA
jgi:hypothetical protein